MLDIPAQNVITRDNVSVKVSAVLGKHELDDLLAERERLNRTRLKCWSPNGGADICTGLWRPGAVVRWCRKQSPAGPAGRRMPQRGDQDHWA